MAPAALNEASFKRGLRSLARRDRDLAGILRRLGPPPLWAREPGFPTLIYIILEQQVSLASARAAYDRLLASGPLTPARFLGFDDAALKAIGFSRQKTAYGRGLARAVADGELDLAALEAMTDAEARVALQKVKGVGPWTAEIYLLMALLRPDAWPSGDLALAVALQYVKGLPARPGPDEVVALGRAWQPWRAVAARLLWHHYLSGANAI